VVGAELHLAWTVIVQVWECHLQQKSMSAATAEQLAQVHKDHQINLDKADF
jgi:G:T-mismatch repair DNA endonuclease (very short patch repair protein)